MNEQPVFLEGATIGHVDPPGLNWQLGDGSALPFRTPLLIPESFEMTLRHTGAEFQRLARALAGLFPHLARLTGPPARVRAVPPTPAPRGDRVTHAAARARRAALLRSRRRAIRRNTAWQSRLDRRQHRQIKIN